MKSLTAGAVFALLGGPALFAGAQTYGNNGNPIQSTHSTTGSSTFDNGTGTTTGAGSVNNSTRTPGIPSTGVGSSQAAADAVLLGISAVTALIGGYFLTTGRRKVV